MAKRRANGQHTIFRVRRNGKPLRRANGDAVWRAVASVNGKRVAAEAPSRDSALLRLQHKLDGYAAPDYGADYVVNSAIYPPLRLSKRQSAAPSAISNAHEITVAEAFDAFMAAELAKPPQQQRAARTMAHHKSNYRAHLAPTLAQLRVAALTAADLANVLAPMENPGTRRSIVTTMSAILGRPDLTRPLLKAVGAEAAEYYREQKHAIIATVSAIKHGYKDAVLSNCETAQDKAMWLLRCLGLRQGEVLGALMDACYNLDKDYTSIEDKGAVFEVKTQLAAGVVTTRLKTLASTRVFGLSGENREILKKHYTAQYLFYRNAGYSDADIAQLPLFTKPGTVLPVSPWADEQKWHQIRPWEIRSHLLRGIAATIAREKGLSDGQLMAHFGWSSPKQIENYDKREGSEKSFGVSEVL